MSPAPFSGTPAATTGQDRNALDARRIGQVESHDSLHSKLARLREGEHLSIRIRRFSAESPASFESFDVPYSKWMRVLDALIYISEELGSDLEYRWCCGSRMCGMCALRVNGREVLACWAAVEPMMTIEPLRNAPVIRDLVVDRQPYERLVQSLRPWIQRRAPYRDFPERLTHRQMKFASKALDCISCMACYSACPVVGLGNVTQFAGPAPLVQVAQKALDPRDAMDRVGDLIERASIFSCISCYRCEEVCPTEIPIVSGVIEPLKRLAFAGARHKERHQSAFLEVVRRRGRIDPTELMLRVNGIRVNRMLWRAGALLVKGKISPFRTIIGHPIKGIRQVRAMFRRLAG